MLTIHFSVLGEIVWHPTLINTPSIFAILIARKLLKLHAA
jgi:hypothetical protein